MLVNMTSRLDLHEGGARIASRKDLPGSQYKVRIMGWDEGADMVHGSSADYPVSVIKRDMAEALPVGSRSRANHDQMCEGGGGDIRRVIGKTTAVPWAEADGMYTNLYISEQWSKWFEEFGDVVGLSISMAGEIEESDEEDPDYDPEAKPVLKRFLSAAEYPYASLDVVEAPGADGRIMQAIESAKQVYEGFNIREQASFIKGKPLAEKKTSGTPADEKNEGINMDEATLRQILGESQAATVAAVDKKIAEALTPETPKDEAPKLEVVAEAIVSAGLTEGGRKSVYEKVELGMNLEAAIESEKAREDSIRKELGEKKGDSDSEGVVFAENHGASFKESGDFEAKMSALIPKGGRL